MEVGLVGLPYTGKSTLFNALTALQGGGAGGAMKANVGVAHLPDANLDTLAGLIPPQKVTRATVKIVDAPGLAAGGGAENAGKVLAAVREVDALCHVVRCFDPGGQAPTPERDIDAFNTELVLADLQVVETALPKAERSAKSGDKKAVTRHALLQKLKPVLEEGRPARVALAGIMPNSDEDLAQREMALLTAKKVLYVANVADDDLGGEGAAARAVRGIAERDGAGFLPVCAKLEAELAELPAGDQAEMLSGLGLKEPALPALAHALYSLLGLQCFYTAGPKEVRAWTIRKGDTALRAAGAIHSDIERGFIRAEIYTVGDLVQHKTEKAIKEAGKMRAEGKGYVMQPMDVVHFLFNV